ncbi:hypothetical protein [Mesorhizobium sp. M0633]|uniref:hypothetical protein n=1 Tax=Mesorhizobium sp. M0633 TaxID=2956977 RepID=UPI003339FFBB
MQRKNSENSESNNKQYQKFKEAARELETDQSEEAFDRVLKKVVKAPPPKDGKEDRR